MKAKDQAQRDEALDVRESFIVQAPAGSGKTELLTQRFLALLAVVEKPEEIVAITFTRKASSEMRRRISDALQRAADDEAPAEAHERKTWELGRAALQRDKQQQWQLLQQPSRLRVLTFDALCASLARQMPVLSRFGASPGMASDPHTLYIMAARRTLEVLDTDEAWSPSVERVLSHLDNDFSKVEQLLANMLAKRDQWLRHLGDSHNPQLERETLEAVLAELVANELNQLHTLIEGRLHALPALAAFAVEHWPEGKAAPEVLRGITSLPGSTGNISAEDLPAWRELIALLLTGTDTWRSRLDKNMGFPVGKKEPEKSELAEKKTAMKAVIESLADDKALLDKLVSVRNLPDAGYTDEQWAVFEALADILRIAGGYLKVVFAETSEVDFVEVSQAANMALGEPDNPTDLALALDYRISHLLVDEFQDTSVSQYELLHRLIAGWQQDDGRSLFVVGDPMQSIYRFREAQVGLYLRARKEGVGQIKLKNVQLTQNFRSCVPIIDWVNDSFGQVFPQQEDRTIGAVTYAASVSSKEGEHASVTVHPFIGNDRQAEANRVLERVQTAKQTNPDGSIAILVRNRSHLVDIVTALRHANLSYRAVDIDSLSERQVIQDVVALARALMHRGDRLAWLSVLRAPWCGLIHSDLLLVSEDRNALIVERMRNAGVLSQLSDDGRKRLERIKPIVDAALSSIGRKSWRRLVEGAWIALAGPACVYTESDIHDVSVLLDRIEQLEQAGELHDPLRLNSMIEDLYAAPDSDGDPNLQLMTIHKSKGLQFDTVIIPGLGRKPRSDDKSLLLWSELPQAHDENVLLLAPVHGTGEDEDPIYQYLRRVEVDRNTNEATRLLYVAVTRAKQHVHLLGHVNEKQGKDGEPELSSPASTSLLKLLWPVVCEQFERVHSQGSESTDEDEALDYRSVQGVSRLPLAWQQPEPPAAMAWQVSEL
ncbi:MAG: UvrD-helicase domain-containing protein, partial [Proteobacteria bacterium]|nr:UvrD-helicase domain-containing protein [Pseudomonadota bacterium]